MDVSRNPLYYHKAPRRDRYRFKAWQICTQNVIIEIVTEIHNNVRTDKIHTHTHKTQHTHLFWVCVYKNQMVYCGNTCQKITTDGKASRTVSLIERLRYTLYVSEVKTVKVSLS